MLGPLALVDPDDEELNFDPDILGWAMADVGHSIVRNVNPAHIVERRRANFQGLLDGLGASKACKPVFQTLPAGVCPLCFPVLIYNREEFLWRLNAQGISAARWWEGFHDAVPWDDPREAVFLKDHMVALPVHQQVDPPDLARMVNAVHSACAGRLR